jgi:hypothetical protein
VAVKLRIPRTLLSPLLLLLPAKPLPQILLTPPAVVATQLLEGTLSPTVTVHRHQLGDGRAGREGWGRGQGIWLCYGGGGCHERLLETLDPDLGFQAVASAT